MNTNLATTIIPPELMAELQAAADRAAAGPPERAGMRAAFEEMDRIRETILAREGVLDIGVPAIRQLRGDLPDA